ETGRPQTVALSLGGAGRHELTEYPAGNGSVGMAVPAADAAPVEAEALAHLAGIINALATPVAIFNAGRGLVQCNRAYCELWRLDPAWLRPGLDERAILDKL